MSQINFMAIKMSYALISPHCIFLTPTFSIIKLFILFPFNCLQKKREKEKPFTTTSNEFVNIKWGLSQHSSDIVEEGTIMVCRRELHAFILMK